MKLFFKPEDFQYVPGFKLTEASSNSAADTANQLLLDRGIRVYGNQLDEEPVNKDMWRWLDKKACYHDRRALLINIENIEGNIHIPRAHSGSEYLVNGKTTCMHCGIKMRLVETWVTE